MIDNLVRIGHKVTVGQGTVIVARVGTAGGTTFGDYVFLAAQFGTAGHPRIGARGRGLARSREQCLVSVALGQLPAAPSGVDPARPAALDSAHIMTEGRTTER